MTTASSTPTPMTKVATMTVMEMLAPKPISKKIGPFTMILWGPPKVGKTELAATAPGELLWINFDPDGYVGLAGKPGIHVMDFVGQKPEVARGLTEGDKYGISNFLVANPQVKTVVLDSLSSLGDAGFAHGLKSKNKTIDDTNDKDFRGVWNSKNLVVNMGVRNLVRIAKEHGKNFIAIAHEDVPQRDQQGSPMAYTLMLGSSLSVDVPKDFSEVWHLSERAGKRYIMIRAARMRFPVSSRMFHMTGPGEFEWNYNADTGKGDRMEHWVAKWLASGQKIDVPVGETK